MTAKTSQPRASRFPTLEKYDVLEELGHGGMATVYRARDLRLGRDVAVKVIHPHLRDSAEAVRRFSIEARAVAKLRHANIVEVYDVSSPDEQEQYLVVELLRGVTLRKLLAQHGALPAEVAAAIGVEILGAIAHAHEAGVVHRDVKPENVILEHRARAAGDGAKEGDRFCLKLTDFGIAKLLDAQGVTSTGQVLGSPAHMAPEQIEGRDVDGRTDVYGVGVLLYECLTGHLPFEGANPAQVLRRVLEGEYPSVEREQPSAGRTWSAVVDRALAADVDDRWKGALAMRDALAAELTRLGVGPPRAEIEAWLDDPPGYTAAHAEQMKNRLCALATEASHKGDSLASAGDYNRALAYAPNDAALLGIVARMNRRRARVAALRRARPYAIFGLVLAGGLLGSLPSLLRRVRAPVLDASMELPPTPPVTPPSTPVTRLPLPATPEVAPSSRQLARPTVGPRAALPLPKAQAREVRFGPVSPPQGVRVAIDGAPPMPLDASKPLALDDKVHTLIFSCEADLCEPYKRIVDPGDHPLSLPVRLTIKSSRLILRGFEGRHYVLSDDPTHYLDHNEIPNVVQMPDSESRVVKVVEVETRVSRSVDLRAGRASKLVDFTTP